ncbi:plant invertase/pectin methylesterase inhibitor superfamily protein [Actinidia rufa]|uniref:Plant invertase/pectin methylesterase inhibitor superfamily protein n=1 Tax=Actinidia rufa TaxID=165716 RepID=A0A7J0ECW7_9ERIC|nr:plant invertase/pectin methylesterase inhibitor superfamily protein [Actinidia rufa]
MARKNPVLLPLILSLILYIAGPAESAVSTGFIRALCRAIEYPVVCVQSLSAYARAIQKNPHQLAQTVLSVSLSRAQSMKGFVKKLTKFKGPNAREYEAIRDCLDEMGDTVDQTWVNAALTDENTCLDGFTGRAMDGKIKASGSLMLHKSLAMHWL